MGSALRHWRDRTAPRDPPHGRAGTARGRRAPGLRREELAALAGVSVDYVTRLEQGRTAAPSVAVLAALARALGLSPVEHDHLFRLARQAPPAPQRMPGGPWGEVRRLIDRLPDTPAGVYDPAWTLVTWNPLFAALMGDPAPLPDRERNVPWQHFALGGGGRVRHTPEQTARFEEAVVGDLRTATGRYPADPRLDALVADLRAASGRFAALWDGHAVGTHARDTKTVRHPHAGTLALDCDVLAAPGADGRQGARVVLLTPQPGSPAEAALRALARGFRTP
ncbi:helix-turn-helix transcriptional regulator [Streptomyces sp. SB3404]|uniref:Helix-turn-helix transcriptional regulator n=1 Tax=Streptomyces boncukensis TaxID=2711219 RepID=A0A6G4WQP7_9ACTN|nr:helix-turn-helix domain-containing protein [Streptomyces boncukensis]NGO67586.1 helix-turn-helix transcriptional regulator [Streptomyces boncukensis]